jgi:hypothetical protein
MGITRAVVPNRFSQPATNDARPLSCSLTSGQKKAIFAATLGTVVEWTDWLLLFSARQSVFPCQRGNR